MGVHFNLHRTIEAMMSTIHEEFSFQYKNIDSTLTPNCIIYNRFGISRLPSLSSRRGDLLNTKWADISLLWENVSKLQARLSPVLYAMSKRLNNRKWKAVKRAQKRRQSKNILYSSDQWTENLWIKQNESKIRKYYRVSSKALQQDPQPISKCKKQQMYHMVQGLSFSSVRVWNQALSWWMNKRFNYCNHTL